MHIWKMKNIVKLASGRIYTLTRLQALCSCLPMCSQHIVPVQ